MVDRLIGATEHFVVSGDCGREYKEELKKLKKQLKAQGRKVQAIVVTKAIILTEPIEKEPVSEETQKLMNDIIEKLKKES